MKEQPVYETLSTRQRYIMHLHLFGVTWLCGRSMEGWVSIHLHVYIVAGLLMRPSGFRMRIRQRWVHNETD